MPQISHSEAVSDCRGEERPVESLGCELGDADPAGLLGIERDELGWRALVVEQAGQVEPTSTGSTTAGSTDHLAISPLRSSRRPSTMKSIRLLRPVPKPPRL